MTFAHAKGLMSGIEVKEGHYVAEVVPQGVQATLILDIVRIKACH